MTQLRLETSIGLTLSLTECTIANLCTVTTFFEPAHERMTQLPWLTQLIRLGVPYR